MIEERVRWWSYQRQLLGHTGSDISAVLRSVIAVYGVNPTAPLSLAARCAAFDPQELRRQEDAFEIVRVPGMRTSGFAVARETLPLIWAATRRPIEKHRWRTRDAGIDLDEYARLRSDVLQAATTPRSARELRADLGYGASLSPVLQTMAFEGVLIRVGPPAMRSNSARYLATDVALGGPIARGDREQALTWLAAEYLRAFGPARCEDFAWWAGLRRAFAGKILSVIETVDIGDGLLLPAADVDAFERITPPDPDTLDILPKWDCWSMGYARDGRHRLIAPEHLPRALDKDNNMLGLILRGGAAIGVWTRRSTTRRLDVALDLFDAPGPRLRAAIETRFDSVLAALELRSATFTHSAEA